MLQVGLAAYIIVTVIDMASVSTTATLHYNLAITFSVLYPPCTLMYSSYYIARVGLPFVLFYFSLLNGIFFEAQIQISWIGRVNVNQWRLILLLIVTFEQVNAGYITRGDSGTNTFVSATSTTSSSISSKKRQFSVDHIHTKFANYTTYIHLQVKDSQ